MFIVFIFYYTLRKFVKSQKWFLAITAIVFVATSVIHAFPQFYAWGDFRAFSAMSLGVLISFLPSIKLKKGCPVCSNNRRKEKIAKKVLNIDLNIVFDSLHDAAKSINNTKGVTPISNCCKGKRKSAYGYHWKFVN